MIFIAKNEKGEPSWKLILEDRKTVTRRLKPLPIGKEFAVQPGRGKFAICRGMVVSCMPHKEWILSECKSLHMTIFGMALLYGEAHKEGFGTWGALKEWFDKKGIDIDTTYRIEFVKKDTNISNRK